MTTDYDSCRDRLGELAAWYSQNHGDRNEATTRLHLIDTLFFDCLGWETSDAEAEQSQAGTYTDYTFSAPRPILVVEAKREGEYFEVPSGKTNLEYSLTSLFRDFQALEDAIRQAAGYCVDRGIPFGAVTNGHQIVTFLAYREDGVPPLEGTALVFPALEFMEKHFRDLWEVLSKPGVEEQNLKHRVAGDIYPQLPPKLSASITNYPGSKNRNPFQTNLQIVSELVIEDVAKSRDLEPRFLKECYCKSGALSQHSLVSKNILRQRYAALFGNDPSGPTLVPAEEKTGIAPDLLAESLSRRPILLLGDAGVGKTTFIRHLIHVDAPDVFENAVSLYLDLGSQATLTDDLRSYVMKDMEAQLRNDYGQDIYHNNFVRGVYNLQLERFRDGIYGELRETDPAAYKKREIEFLQDMVDDRPAHLRNSIEHIAKGREKQIVIFLDNADQRNYEIQQEAFLISQEVADRWPATIFVALRPETFHRSQREGALSGYHPKAFSIAPPRMDQVLYKRLNFAKKITTGEIQLERLHEDVQVRLRSLESLLEVFLYSVHRNDELLECIDNIAAGNIRRGLNLVKQFFGSGHVNTKKIVEIYDRSGSYLIPLHEFLRAVIFGDTVHYDPTRSPIVNVFDISRPDAKEHFLVPLLVSYLTTAGERKGHGGFVEATDVYDRLQSIGFVPGQIDYALSRCLRGEMIETSEREVSEDNAVSGRAIRATTLGVYHTERLARLFAYVDAMIVDTPVVDRDRRDKIEAEDSIFARLDRAEIFTQYLDDAWLPFEAYQLAYDWREVSGSLKERMADIRTRL